MQLTQNHNQVRQCIIIPYCNSGLGSSKGNGDKDAESDAESVEHGSGSKRQNGEGQESAEERNSEEQVDVGGSEATGEAGSDWETENIINNAIECRKHQEKEKCQHLLHPSKTKFQVRHYIFFCRICQVQNL